MPLLVHPIVSREGVARGLTAQCPRCSSQTCRRWSRQISAPPNLQEGLFLSCGWAKCHSAPRVEPLWDGRGSGRSARGMKRLKVRANSELLMQMSYSGYGGESSRPHRGTQKGRLRKVTPPANWRNGRRLSLAVFLTELTGNDSPTTRQRHAPSELAMWQTRQFPRVR